MMISRRSLLSSAVATSALMVVSSGCALAQNTTTDVLIADGKISRIGHALSAANAQSIDCTGCLLLSSFIDTHVHLDKTRFGAPERLHHIATASVAERAANKRKLRVELKHDPYTYGSNLMRQMAAMGTTHLRSHIDIDPLTKLSDVEALMRIREDFKGYMSMEFVAFPQSGIMKSPGVADYMAQALDMGVEYCTMLPTILPK